MEKVFVTSLCHYAHKNKTFRTFLDNYTDSYRQEFQEYLVHHTVLSGKRYPLSKEESSNLHKAIVLGEKIAKKKKKKPASSRRELVFHFHIAFRLDPEMTIDTRCNQIMKEKVSPEDLLEWYERLKVSDEEAILGEGQSI